MPDYQAQRNWLSLNGYTNINCIYLFASVLPKFDSNNMFINLLFINHSLGFWQFITTDEQKANIRPSHGVIYKITDKPYCHQTLLSYVKIVILKSSQPNKEKTLADQYAELIKEAQKQLGIVELSKAYGYYDLLMKQSSIYFKSIRPKLVIINSADSA